MSSVEMKDRMIVDLVSLVCTLENEAEEMKENNACLAMALNQTTSAYGELYDRQIARKSLFRRIKACLKRKHR